MGEREDWGLRRQGKNEQRGERAGEKDSKKREEETEEEKQRRGWREQVQYGKGGGNRSEIRERRRKQK